MLNDPVAMDLACRLDVRLARGEVPEADLEAVAEGEAALVVEGKSYSGVDF